jgi:hypothetical protein
VVIESPREKPIGNLHEVDPPRPKHILGGDRLAPLARNEAGHDVWLAVQAKYAAIAATSETVRTMRAMQLGAARQSEPPLCQQGESDRLASFGPDGLVVESKLDWVAQRNQPAEHGDRISLER